MDEEFVLKTNVRLITHLGFDSLTFRLITELVAGLVSSTCLKNKRDWFDSNSSGLLFYLFVRRIVNEEKTVWVYVG
jgi:hypothetical protein